MTPRIPISLRLKKQAYKGIAEAQDSIVKELYSVFDKAVLHGGTAIWRCYGGNRFSEDIDAYIPRDIEKIELFFERLKNAGFLIEKKKISERSIFSQLRINRIPVRFEAVFKDVRGSIRDYENIDGTTQTIYTLTPEQIIREKIGAYTKRKKIRDLYDIFYLLKHVTDMKDIRGDVEKFIGTIEPSIDEKNLKVLIVEGISPDTKNMIEYIKSTIRHGQEKTP